MIKPMPAETPYIVAASRAFSRNYDPMIEIIRRALATAWKAP